MNARPHRRNLRSHRTLIQAEMLERRQLLTWLVSGETLTGTVSATGSVHFSAEFGGVDEFVIIAVGDTSNSAFRPKIRIESDGDDPQIKNSSGEHGAFLSFVAEGSIYDVTVTDATGSHGGSFKITTFCTWVHDLDDSDIPMQSGQEIISTIAPGELGIYKIDSRLRPFTVIASEVTSGASMELGMILMGGGSIVQKTHEQGILGELESGGYVIIYEAGQDDSGTYRITFAGGTKQPYEADPDYGQLTTTTVDTGTLPAGDQDVLYFYADQGVACSVTMSAFSGHNLQPRLKVYDAVSGQIPTLSAGSTVNTAKFTATKSGRYFVVLSDDVGDSGGSYNVSLTLSSGTGVLTDTTIRVFGTENADAFTARVSDGQLRITDFISPRLYDPDLFTQLNIVTYGGDDEVILNGVTGSQNPSVNPPTHWWLYMPVYVMGGEGSDTIKGGKYDDTLTGGGGTDYIYGGDGNDRIKGSGGRDFLYGESNDDRIYGDSGNDYLDGGGNVDRLFGGIGNDTLYGFTQNDKLYGEAGNDRLIGRIGNSGNSGHDILNGGAGTDTAVVDDDDPLVSIEVVI